MGNGKLTQNKANGSLGVTMLRGVDGRMYPAAQLPGGVLGFTPSDGRDPFAMQNTPLASDEAKYGPILSRKVQGGLTTVVFGDGGDGNPLIRQYTGAKGDLGTTVGAAPRPRPIAQTPLLKPSIPHPSPIVPGVGQTLHDPNDWGAWSSSPAGAKAFHHWRDNGVLGHDPDTGEVRFFDKTRPADMEAMARSQRTQMIWDPYQGRSRAYNPANVDDRRLMQRGAVDRLTREMTGEPETTQHMFLTALGDRLHENKEAAIDDVKGVGSMAGWAADHQRRLNLENQLAITPSWAMSPAERAVLQARINAQKALDAQRGAAIQKGLEYSPMGKVVRSGVMAAKGTTAGARTLLSQVPGDVWTSAGHDPTMAVLSVAGGFTGAGGALMKAGALAGKLKGAIEVIDAAVNANKISAATGAAMKAAVAKTVGAAPLLQSTGKQLVHYGTGGPLKGVVVAGARQAAGAMAPVLNTAPGKAVVAGAQQVSGKIKSALPAPKPLTFDHLASKAVKDSVDEEGALVSGPAAKEIYALRRDRVPGSKFWRAFAATSERDMSERIPIPEEFNSLFEPIPVTGLISGLKRGFGVHVAPPGEYNFNTLKFTPNVKRLENGSIVNMTPEEILGSYRHKWTQKYGYDALLNTAAGFGAATYLRDRRNTSRPR